MFEIGKVAAGVRIQIRGSIDVFALPVGKPKIVSRKLRRDDKLILFGNRNFEGSGFPFLFRDFDERICVTGL